MSFHISFHSSFFVVVLMYFSVVLVLKKTPNCFFNLTVAVFHVYLFLGMGPNV